MAGDGHIGADLALVGALIIACLPLSGQQWMNPNELGLVIMLSWGGWRLVLAGWRFGRELARMRREALDEQ